MIGLVGTAFRRLRRRPATSILVWSITAIAIGVTTAIVAVADPVLFQPLPFRASSELVVLPAVRIPAENDNKLAALAPAEILTLNDIARMTTVFHGTGSYVATPMNFGDSTHALPVVVGIVTPTMFELLDVHPAAGRTFDTEEGVANGPAVALVGYEFWQSHLGGRPVLDSTIILNSHPYLVVGVLPARFSFPAGSQVWIPMSVPLTATVVGHVRGTFGATVVARLKEGVTLTHASQAMLLRWQQALMGSSPNAPRYSNLTARIKAVRASGAAMSLQVFIGGNTRPLVTYLLVGVSLIYLIVCANLTGLLLADGLRRRREFMIYEALGEKRARTVYRLLVETGVMCLSGSIAGMVIAVMLVGAFRGLVPEGFTGMRDVIIGSRVIAVAVGSALVATIVIATASATQALSFITPELLRASPGLIHYQGSRAILRRGLVAVQVASATALLVGALLLTRTLYAISTAPLGLTPGPVAETWIRLGGQDIAARTQRISEIVDEIRRAPGVVEAGAANEMPMTNLAAEQRIYTGASSTDSIDARVTYVSPGYLETLQIPISAGRVFDNADGAGGSKVALVNGALARRIGSGFGVDGFIRLPGDRDLYKVVGVVGDVRDDGPIHPMPPHVYLPLSLGAPSDIAILARSTLPASQMTTALRAAAANAGHGQTVYGVQTLTASLQSSLVSTRVATTLSAAMAFFAVLMALIGVYGLITFDIDSRYRELGIRAALGASPGMVLQTVGRSMSLAIGTGLLLGMIAAVMVAKVLTSLVVGISVHDVMPFAVASLAMIVVSACAIIIPGARVLRLNPAEIMRDT